VRVGVLCEVTGIVRDAFLRRGHDAISCDIQATESPGPHIQGDCLAHDWSGFDLLICHPPCTYIASSGIHWNRRVPGRAAKTEEALAFVRRILDLRVPRLALENPVGLIGTRIRACDQTIQPWQFGHRESKATCLWLRNLPPLRPTNVLLNPAWIPCDCCDEYCCTIHKGQHASECPCPVIDDWEVDPYSQGGRWNNQTASGQNNASHAIRSRTYEGWAEAMAEQWGGLGQWKGLWEE